MKTNLEQKLIKYDDLILLQMERINQITNPIEPNVQSVEARIDRVASELRDQIEALDLKQKEKNNVSLKPYVPIFENKTPLQKSKTANKDLLKGK